MAIEGQIRDVGLADICQLLAMGRKTGCLTVIDGANFGYIYFNDGRVIYSTVLNRPDRLGEILVRNNVVTRAELSEAMETQAHRQGKRLGKILVDRGSLSQEQLERFVTIQIEEAVYHLFSWNQGSFHFDPDQQPEASTGTGVSLNAESLLLEAARRVDELSVIQKKITSLQVIFAVLHRPETGSEVHLTQHQERVLSLLDGERTVEEVVQESGLVEFDVSKAIYALLQAGFVEKAGEREAFSGEEQGSRTQERLRLGSAFYRAGMPEDAEREYLAALEFDPAEPTARLRLGLLALRSGKAETAFEHFSAVSENETPAILLNRALALEYLERFDEACAILDRGIEIFPDHPRISLAHGISALRNQDAGRAVASFRSYRRTIAAEGVPEPIYFAFAILAFAATGEMETALQVGREGLTRYPESGPILINLGAILEKRGETDAAEALFLRAAAESPPLPQAHKNLGDLAYRRGDQAGARAHYERALRINPKLGDDAYLKLGNLVYKEGDQEGAVVQWKKALELNPANDAVRTNLDLAAAAPGRRT
jgi:tetratricopeptide (TPR) repeat protein